MHDFADAALQERVLAATVSAGDAALTRKLLAEAGMTCRVCASAGELCDEFASGAGVLLVAEEALANGGSARLASALQAQPVWSDIPVLLLTGRGSDSMMARRAIETLPNVTVLERPVRVVTLVSALRSSLKARRRQYALRDHVDALALSEQRFRAMSDELPLMVWMHDADGRQEFVNQTFCEFFGVTRAEMRNGRWQLLMHPDESKAYLEEFLACVRERRDFHAEVRVRRGDGEWRRIESWGRARFGLDGEFLGHIGTSADVSERDRAVTERERALALLQEADRRKNEFLAVLAHELRNPLTPLRTGVELLRHAAANSKGSAQTRQMMERQVRHLARLVDDLVDVARITRGELTLRKVRANLAQIVNEAIEASRTQIEAQQHRLAVSLPTEALQVDGDAVRLTQVLVNLLVNAARYTPAGGEISVHARRDAGEALLEIADTGVGIREDMLEEIFDLFTQVEGGASRAQGGLGIGLALARSIVKLHGGSIEARSAGLGKGSTFLVRLPLAAEQHAPASAHAAQPRDATTRSLRVLVVDDDHDVAATTSMFLELLGHETRIAHDAASALEVAGDPPPDVVLLDIGMPGMDGYDLAQELRKRCDYASVPLVAVSGFGREMDLERSKAAGFAAHLVKPFEPEALERVLHSLAATGSAARLSPR